ncbi:unnamed protein product [Protopolystoma xenopodis]|uniref:Uncharacterized protein n=1 Tax=Protopolystoma xenopodis TaxID=117903 RepID=A0A448WP19_9PLAT|nr:unnamed protein product [Protopolystoma xenopodis]
MTAYVILPAPLAINLTCRLVCLIRVSLLAVYSSKSTKRLVETVQNNRVWSIFGSLQPVAEAGTESPHASSPQMTANLRDKTVAKFAVP